LKVLLTTIGSSGDINPFIAIGRALRDRGHEATLLVNPFFESAVRQAGLGYLGLGDEIDFRVMGEVKDIVHPRRGGMVVLRQLVMPHIRTIYDRVDQAISAVTPDLVVAHHISLGAKWACDKRGVPWATAVLAPSMWLNPNDPSIFGGLPERTPAWLLRASLRVGKLQCRWMIDPGINRARRELGLEPVRDQVFVDAREGHLTLGMWSEAFRGRTPGDPEGGAICGFPWHDRFERFEGRSAEVLRYLDECERAGEAPLLFTLGTAVVHASGRFYHDAAEAARRLGRRAILVTNRAEYAPTDLPAGVRAFEYVPFSQAMPRAACVVHHGGIGTTAQGLRSGRPTVIIPHSYDQFDNAARAARLGVSKTLHRTRVNADRLVLALRDVLERPGVAERARELAARVGADDGGPRAADLLERMAGRALTQA
jgi:UDP:flavonoid glycosyltransferase YjiC (YdhE family)